MARRRSATLTEAEQRLMEVVWSRGPMTVAAIVAALDDDAPLAYNSVQTIDRKSVV